MTTEMKVLTNDEIENVSGGFLCGGLCMLGAFGAGVALLGGGIAVGGALRKALR